MRDSFKPIMYIYSNNHPNHSWSGQKLLHLMRNQIWSFTEEMFFFLKKTQFTWTWFFTSNSIKFDFEFSQMECVRSRWIQSLLFLLNQLMIRCFLLIFAHIFVNRSILFINHFLVLPFLVIKNILSHENLSLLKTFAILLVICSKCPFISSLVDWVLEFVSI